MIVGRDTRLSSPALSQACVRGVEAVGGSVVDLGVVTTPQLHYMVVATNTEGAYGEPTIQGYYAKISGAFKKFISLTEEKKVYNAKLMFDGANGVGAPAMVEFNKLLNEVLEVEMVNQGEGELNSGCGADYVKVSAKPLFSHLPFTKNKIQVNQSGPLGQKLVPGLRCVSVDGDADRVISSYHKFS